MLTIALAGNPNCGKSALFNALTGVRQRTGNWPGVTVDRKEGTFDLEGQKVTVVDLPGIYSLDAASIDERITRDYLLSGEAKLIINILDASNLERNLYFSVQLLEMGVPLLIALNMMDVARRRGIEIDTERLSQLLGCPVVPLVATKGEGLPELQRQILQVVDGRRRGGYPLTHGETIEQAMTELTPAMAQRGARMNPRWLALKLLEGDPSALALADDGLTARMKYWRGLIESRSGEETDVHIAEARYNHAHTLAQQVTRTQTQLGRTLTDRIDKLVLGRYLGVPFFLLVMYLMFLFTINLGGAFIDFFDGLGAALFVDGFGSLLARLGAPEWLVVILAEGVGGGLKVVGTFIPIISFLYLFLSFLEDSGYMARAAFVMDRFMRGIGLPGKAFVPMIVGFGCNVPAVMATRTLENPRERKLTILMNPFMSCGARLPVYALFAAAFFPTNGQNLVFGLYLIGILVAVLTGLVMKRTLLAGESAGFIMELPPYHLPSLKGILLRTWDRLKLFVTDAGKVIVVMVLALNLLNSLGTDGSFGNKDSDNSMLSTIGKGITPVFSPMGIAEDNWPATVGIFSGVLAKEVVVGTLDAVYTKMAQDADGNLDDSTPEFAFWPAIAAAFATIPENLSKVADALVDPLGLDVGDISSVEAAADEQEVDVGIFGMMESRFDGAVGAFAYLLFILLYSPCAATIGAIVRETGRTWAAFVVFWTTTVAYSLSTLFYQLARFGEHPLTSLAWAAGIGLLLTLIIIGLRLWGYREEDIMVQPSPTRI